MTDATDTWLGRAIREAAASAARELAAEAAKNRCPRCNGAGEFEGDTCRVCSGTGTRSAHLPPLT